MLRTLLSRQIEDACRLKAKTLLVSSSVGTGQKEALLTSYWGNERYNAERFTTMFAPFETVWARQVVSSSISVEAIRGLGC